MTVTPFPRSAMKPPAPPPEPLKQPAHTHLDVPQPVRNAVSGIHQLAATLHASLGVHAATPVVMERTEEQLADLAQRALVLRAALVQERKRMAGRA